MIGKEFRSSGVAEWATDFNVSMLRLHSYRFIVPFSRTPELLYSCNS
jgi:hypothetical protein